MYKHPVQPPRSPTLPSQVRVLAVYSNLQRIPSQPHTAQAITLSTSREIQSQVGGDYGNIWGDLEMADMASRPK